MRRQLVAWIPKGIGMSKNRDCFELLKRNFKCYRNLECFVSLLSALRASAKPARPWASALVPQAGLGRAWDRGARPLALVPAKGSRSRSFSMFKVLGRKISLVPPLLRRGGGSFGALATLLSALLMPAGARADVPADCDIGNFGGVTTLAATSDTSSPCYGKLIVSQSDFDGAGSDHANQGGDDSFSISFNSQSYSTDRWYTGNITDMSDYFRASSFNGDISGWDTSSVENMSYMFYNASSFNGDMSNWDTSNVQNMSNMF